MIVAALGDAHLGRSYYPFTTETGVNQREWDFEQSFAAAVELALAQQPDLIVWLGDIFDHPRPTYRSFRIAQRALQRIREHGVAAVIISGNHDTPRLPGTGSPYSALADAFGEFRFAHRLALRAVRPRRPRRPRRAPDAERRGHPRRARPKRIAPGARTPPTCS